MRTLTLAPGGIMLAAVVLHAIDYAKTAQETMAAPSSAVSAACSESALGDAGPFNLFAVGDVSQSGTDTEGRLAAGGNVTLTDYSIGARLSSADPPTDALVVGSSLTYTRGAVNGSVVSTQGASISNVSFTAGAGYRRGAALDFAGAATRLTALSRSYALLPANGSVDFAYGTLTLAGADARLNVFSVAASALRTANSLTMQVPDGSTVLINVAGTDVAAGNIGTALVGVTAERVLINAADATTLTMDGLGVKGSVLAPLARTTFTNGVIQGQFVTGSLTGNGQFDAVSFRGCLPPS